MQESSSVHVPVQPIRRVLLASLIGTTIEFFDFYIYATAAVLVFPILFFPKQDPATAKMQSFATFALAFFARPIGSALFGHFGDRIGRKATLVTALLTMGISTVLIGLLPTYASIGVAAAVLLALCRCGQGLGLGGEWGGAVLLATENAPPGKEAWYGSFPQLGAPLGFLCSTAIFLLISTYLSAGDLLSWGWRVPFLASAVLVLVGLYIRLQLVETPAFRRSLEQGERVRVPILVVITKYPRELILGILGTTTTFLVFYLMTVFALSWATTALKFARGDYLVLQMAGVLFFGLTIPLSAVLADRIGGRMMLMIATVAIMLFGFAFAPLFGAHDTFKVFIFLAVGFSLTGFTYGPLGAALAALFPTPVRYTGTSLTFNFAGILGASLAPLIATHLSSNYGLKYVGYYLSAAGLVTLVALSSIGEKP
ncbi:MAG TPA: MFS transporter [Steroidobacteraceae bacterium]|nr:MFS transporter [Steroidobacteraceae bacterium]